jgi:hypothetical protein
MNHLMQRRCKDTPDIPVLIPQQGVHITLHDCFKMAAFKQNHDTNDIEGEMLSNFFDPRL